MIELEYELVKKDYIEYDIYRLLSSKTIKKLMFIQQFIIPLIFFIAPFLGSKFTDISFKLWFSIFIILYLAWVLLYPQFFRSIMRIRVERIINKGKQENLFGNHRLTIRPEGIFENNKMGSYKSNWDTVERVIETKEKIYIYTNSIGKYIIPKRYFESVDLKDEFIRLVEMYSGLRKEKK